MGKLDSKLNMDTMPYTAIVKTQSLDWVVTDSAAAGTALATGYKTNCGMISVLPDGSKVETILEAAAKIKKSTGLVTTTTITHATPATFG
jgi:alkaline phosphatase